MFKLIFTNLNNDALCDIKGKLNLYFLPTHLTHNMQHLTKTHLLRSFWWVSLPNDASFLPLFAYKDLPKFPKLSHHKIIFPFIAQIGFRIFVHNICRTLKYLYETTDLVIASCCCSASSVSIVM